VQVDIELEDCQSQLRRIKQRLVPRACWRAGERVANVAEAEAATPFAFPNPDTIARQSAAWSMLQCRDDEAPRGARSGERGNLHFQGKTRAAGVSSFSVGAAAGAGPAGGSAYWQCLPAEQWPGGPAVRMSGSMSGCCPEDGAALASCRVMD
jgi:hypothetical protein